MLYVFYVNAGEMLTFSMDLITASVARLHDVIEVRYGMAVDSQVLLVSGGEHMDPSRLVCSYKSAGTETSPLFLYNKCCPDIAAVTYHRDTADCNELGARVEYACASLPPTRETMANRVRLAQQLYETARESVGEVQQLIHSQHLQHQGWAAVVANFDDLTTDFEKHGKFFDEAYSKFTKKKPQYDLALKGLHSAMDMLGRACLLPCFLKQLDGSASSCASSCNSPPGEIRTADNKTCTGPITLLDWIAQQEQRTSIHELASQAAAEMEKLSDVALERTSQAMHKVLDRVNTEGEEMKEIKGLSNRLSGLEMLLVQAQKYEEEQRQMASTLVQHMNRCSGMGPELASSVLPELSTAHQLQLQQMWRSSALLRDVVQKCAAAKLELCANLRTRLTWVIYAQRKIAQVDGQLDMQSYCLKLLSQKLDILMEVHDAPRVYAALCAEAHRRRLFCNSFRQWADSISVNAKDIYQTEAKYRQKFLERIGRHFLRSLFPKLHLQPPPFATTAPRLSENDVPDVTANDIAHLCDELPELAAIFRGQDDESAVSMLVISRTLLVSSHRMLENHSVTSTTLDAEQSAERKLCTDRQDDRAVLRPPQAGHSTGSAPAITEAASPPLSSYFMSVPQSLPRISSGSFDCSGSFGAKLLSDRDICSDTHSLSPAHIPDEEDPSLIPPTYPDDEAGTGTQFALELDATDFTTAHLGFANGDDQPDSHLGSRPSVASAATPRLPSAAMLPARPVVTAERLLAWHERVAEAVRRQRSGVAECRRVVTDSCGDFKRAVDTCTRLVERCRAEQALREAEERDRRSADEARLAAAEHTADEREQAARQALLQCEVDVDAARQELSDRLAASEACQCRLAEQAAAEVAMLRQRLVELARENEELHAASTRLQRKLDVAEQAQQILPSPPRPPQTLCVACQTDVACSQLTAPYGEARPTLDGAEQPPPHLASLLPTSSEHDVGSRTELTKEGRDRSDGSEDDVGDRQVSCQTECTWTELQAELTARFSAETDVAVKQAVADAQRRHEEEMNEIVQRFEEEHDHRMNSMKTSYVADNQVSFNEALFRLAAEKDRVIEKQQTELARLNLQMANSTAAQPTNSSVMGDCQTLHPADNAAEPCPLANTQTEMHTPLKLPVKSVLHQDKVAITTCNVGDLVLLCHDEQHGQYVVFTMGNVLHFLHSDSLEALHLKPDERGSPKANWVVAEVTDKEYCQARKPDNRFRVPVGTRFYRVKAKPWSNNSSLPKTEKSGATTG